MEEEEEMWFNEEEDFAEDLDTYNSVMKRKTMSVIDFSSKILYLYCCFEIF